MLHIYFGRWRVYINFECTISLCVIFKMAEIQVKKGNKQAPGCRHFMSDWDSPNKSSSVTPPTISIPLKQFMAMETVKREQVQILTFVSYFLRTLDKCASNVEELLPGVHSSVSEELAKEIEEMLSFLQIQF